MEKKPKTIGIDARLIRETGIGRYIRNLIRGLGETDGTNLYVVYLTADAAAGFVPPNDRWTVRILDVRWHSLAEQFVMPVRFLSDRLDLLHVPYVTIPLLYPGKMVVTMHDLTILRQETGRASMLPKPVYEVKRFALRMILDWGLRRAVRIIAVSQATAADVKSWYPFTGGKVETVYEGIDSGIVPVRERTRMIEGPYLLYVGNAYPHKNLDMLIDAFAAYRKREPRSQLSLVLVGRTDFFYARLEEKIKSLADGGHIRFLHDVGDAELAGLYRDSEALVFPSKMEGFGLPAVEAAVLGTRLLISDIPVFREILGDRATYLSPDAPGDWTDAFAGLGKIPKREYSELKKRFDWKKTVRETLRIYEHSLGI